LRLLTVILATLFASFSATLGGELVSVRGTVTDSGAGGPLPAAHVRIAGTTRGTIANTAGQYSFQVDPGTYTIIVSMIGYESDTTALVVTHSVSHDVRLRATDIVLPELVITAEDPAVEIIRRAIDRKRHWISKLASYQMDAFTRQVLLRDTSIASVTESFTRGYWQQGDTLREVVVQRRQTANIPSSFNFASVGRIINFNDDEVRFLGFTFVGPTAPDALEYYEVHLVRTHYNQKQSIFEISLTPRSRTTPLFRGTVHIADESYALVGIDVEPNEAFQIPMVKEKHLRYKQQFALFDDEIWLPVDIRIAADFSIGIPGISFPRFGFAQTSVITEYKINPTLPDSLFHRARLVVDSSATRLDTTFWASHAVLPLSPAEHHAYGSLDSTQSLELQFRPGGVSMTIGGDGGAVSSFLQYADIAFNRVEGLHLGVHCNETLLPVLTGRAGVAYAFASKSSSLLIGGTLYTAAARRFGIGVDAYKAIAAIPEAGFYGPLVNSVTSLLYKNDYSDYYASEGWRAFITMSPTSSLSGTISFIDERQTSVAVRTDYSLFSRSRKFRDNRSIDDGMLRSLAFSARYGDTPIPLNMAIRNSLEVTFEYSSPEFAKSSFDFTRLDACLTLNVPTFAHNALFSPGFNIRIAGGLSKGKIPLQRVFSLESASSGIGPFGVMRGMSVKEFGGTDYFACNIEHNFRSLPFLALGIPFFYERSLEFIVHGGIARSWNRAGLPVQTPENLYGEAGFGINRLFDLLRADFTWRLSAPTRFQFTISVAQIL
jgi:hypothetical protein